MAKEVRRYRFYRDQAAGLIGKILLRKAILATGYPENLLQNFSRAKREKPFVPGWMPFNISHSGEYVVLAYTADQDIGIDIEKHKNDLNWKQMTTFFCVEEIDFILNNDNKEGAFFKIWARKEAILKASGVGMSAGLNQFDCRTAPVVFEEKVWHLQEISIAPGYACCLASEVECLYETERVVLSGELKKN